MTDVRAAGTRVPAVARRDDLAAAVQAAADAYGESHSSRGLFVPSGLRRSAYRPSEPFTGPGFA